MTEHPLPFPSDVVVAEPTRSGAQAESRSGDAEGSPEYANRSDAAASGFEIAIRCYEALVRERRRRQFIDDWAKTYIGLASLRVVDADERGADAAVAAMLRALGELDPARQAHGSRQAHEMLASLR